MTNSSNTGESGVVYRLALSEEWDEARTSGGVPQREIDIRDGYFHLSTRDQVLETARLHFRDAQRLYALEIPVKNISGALYYELAPKRGEKFPHFYGELRTSYVRRVIRLKPTEDGFTFGEAL